MSSLGQEFVEVFLQEASEHLQFLREYGGILLDPYPAPDDLERLYVSAHTLKGSSGMYGFPLFSEVSAKLAHIFQYAMNVGISADATAPLVEFISEAVAVLESDLWMISANSGEAVDELAAFKAKYPFAFQTVGVSVGGEQTSTPAQGQVQIAEPDSVPPDLPAQDVAEDSELDQLSQPAHAEAADLELSEQVSAEQEPTLELPADGEVPPEILEFFVPEAEEHLQTVTDCLLALEANANDEDIHRLFRAMHTIKGAAAQVGLARIAFIAHRAEDLIGRLRDGLIKPSGEIVDLCLELADVIKKFLYRQWPDETTALGTSNALLSRVGKLAPQEQEDDSVETTEVTSEAPDSAPMSSAGNCEVEPLIVDGQEPTSVPEIDLNSFLADAADAPSSGSEHAEHDSSDDHLQRQPAAHPEMPPAISQAPVREQPSTESEPAAALKKEPSAIPQSRSVRIGLERLDRMMNAVGELVINRTRMLGRVAELERLADVLNFSKARMSDKITEFQEKYEFSKISGLHQPERHPSSSAGSSFPYRGGYSTYAQKFDSSLAEFSELEMDRYDEFSILSRSLTEISADITEILTQLDGFVRRVDSDIDEFTKLAHRLQDEITAARMVPIGNLYTRITRTVRDAAKATGKQVELQLSGADTELDNNIIQQIADPLLHLVRNSVAHGIERADERYSKGKPDNGTINVRAYHRGNHVYVEVEDDGRGLDYENIRNTAVELGLVSAEDAGRLSERALQDLLFHPGFSTAPRKTELAGRGVGLDVVQSNIRALNGEIEIETQKGFGTRFTLKVPLTLIISQALFVRCGKDVFAMPLAFVEEIRRVREADIEEVGGKLLTKVRDVVTEVVRLDHQLGLEPIQPINGYLRLVVVNVAGRQAGVVVEDVLRKDEIVIKNLGEYLRNVKLFPGATIAPDGTLILMIDVNRLIAGESIERRPLPTAVNAARLFFPGASALASGDVPEQAIEAVPDEKVIVLADDSISVRKFVGRMLEKAGYRVRLACDGLEALEILSQTRCNLVITDLEMPRTNGYELMAHVRQNPDFRHLPIMVVTSRAGAKHRDKAVKQGANAFLVKPVQEDQLVAEVEKLIGPAATPAQRSMQAAAHETMGAK